MDSSTSSGWMANALAVAALAGALYLVVLLALYLTQRRILFRPDPAPPLLERLGLAGVTVERIVTADGLDLLSWYLAPVGAAPVMLYLHGNAGHVGHRGERVRAIAARGWGALFVEYRGFGGNPGRISEAGLGRDAEAGLAWLRRHGIAAERIVLWGESLGSGLAARLAAHHEVGAAVLETPYTSIAAIARRRYPFAPVNLLLKDRFESLVYMPAIRAPVLVAVAGRDRVVPPAMGHALHAAASRPAELWVAEQAGHTELMQFGLLDAIDAFLRRHLSSVQGAAGRPPAA